MHLVADADDAGHVEGLLRRFRLAVHIAEGGEIVQANEGLSRRLHDLGVQWLAHMPDTAVVERGRSGAVEDAVQVAPARRREAGVPVVIDADAVQHRDPLADQMGVEGVHHRSRRPVLFEIEADDLAGGVHARVRAARRGEADGLAAEGGDRRLDRALHGRLVSLGLEAVVARAVVFERQPVAGHPGFPYRSPRGGSLLEGDSTVRTGKGKPRNISPAVCAALPARWTRRSWTAPSPQATVRSPSST